MGPFFFSFGLANRFRFSFQLELGPVIRDPGSSAEISQVPSRISQQQSVIEPVAPQTLCNRQDGIPRKANSEQGLDTASSNLENGSHTPLDQAKTTNKKDTVAARIPSPDAIGSSTGPGARGRLSLIPQEVRNIIYRLLLVSTTVIENPANMFDDEQPLMLHERRKIEDIDPVICRTSRLIYKETQPILYGENSYLFDDGFKLWQFGKSVTSKPLTSFVTHTSIRGKYLVLEMGGYLKSRFSTMCLIPSRSEVCGPSTFYSTWRNSWATPCHLQIPLRLVTSVLSPL